MDVFKSLTVGIKFNKNHNKREHQEELEFKEIKSEKNNNEPKIKKKISTESKNEKINFIRKQHHINVKGETEKQKPLESFDELFLNFSINETLRANLMKLNYKNPTPVQMQIIPFMLQKKQVKVCAPTGSGKTVSFLLPLIQNLIDMKNKDGELCGIRTLILSPTRELAQQILSNAAQLCYDTNIRAHLITSTNETHMKLFHKKKTNILITTTLKLVHMIKNSFCTLKDVEWIIIDEIDKFFEESNQTFKKDLDMIINECKNPLRKFGLFSATTTKEMTGWVHEKLIDGFITVNILPNAPVASVEQELRFVGTEYAKLIELRNIILKGIEPPILIFVQSKNRAEQLHRELMYDGLNIDIIHSDRSGKERLETYKKFREGTTWILICTELMARGIDFRNVSLVVNYDLPTSLCSYVHKIGRVGRAGKQGKAITFFTTEDNNCGLLRDIAKMIKATGTKVEPFLLQLKKSSKKERVALLKKAPKRKNISNLKSSKTKHKKNVNM